MSTCIYFGLLSLYTILCNPFGNDACDFPVLAYQVESMPGRPYKPGPA